MRTGLMILYISYFIAGCKSKEEIPRNILPQKKMQAVLWDMMRADQFLADYILNRDTSLKKKTESIKLYQEIFDINKITKENFQQSFAFYQSHPALLKIIMDSIAVITTPSLYGQKKQGPGTDSLNTPVKPVIPADSVPVLKKPLKIRKTRRLAVN